MVGLDSISKNIEFQKGIRRMMRVYEYEEKAVITLRSG